MVIANGYSFYCRVDYHLALCLSQKSTYVLGDTNNPYALYHARLFLLNFYGMLLASTTAQHPSQPSFLPFRKAMDILTERHAKCNEKETRYPFD